MRNFQSIKKLLKKSGIVFLLTLTVIISGWSMASAQTATKSDAEIANEQFGYIQSRASTYRNNLATFKGYADALTAAGDSGAGAAQSAYTTLENAVTQMEGYVNDAASALDTEDYAQVASINAESDAAQTTALNAVKQIQTATANKVKNDNQAQSYSTGCNPAWGFDLNTCFGSIFQIFGNTILTICSWILWICGQIFEFTLKYSIINFKDFLTPNSTTGMDGPPYLSSITTIWRTFRDLINITYIFILLYTAIGTILNLEGVNYEQTIKNVVISALFINFSMFITKALIDVSNIFTVKIYQQIVTTNGQETPISISVLNKLKLPTVYASPKSLNGLGLVDSIIVTVGGSIFMLLTGFILIAAGILFLIRGIVFIFLLMTSPIAFAPDELKALLKQDLKKKWWEKLKSNILFAPAYMFMMYIAMKVASEISGRSTGTFVDAFKNSGSVAVIINFVFIIILMAMALIVAVQFGAVGSEALAGMMKSMGGFLVKSPLRPVAAIGDRFSKSKLGNTWVGSKLNNATFGQNTKKKAFDGTSIADDRKKEKTARDKRYDGYASAVAAEGKGKFENNPDQRKLASLASIAAKETGVVEGAKANDKQIEDKEKELKNITDQTEKAITDRVASELGPQQKDIEKEEAELAQMKGSPLAAMNGSQIKSKEQAITAKKNAFQQSAQAIKTAEYEKVQKQQEGLKADIATLQKKKTGDGDSVGFDELRTIAEMNLGNIESEQKTLKEKREQAIMEELNYVKDVYGVVRDMSGNEIKGGIPTDAKTYAEAYRNAVADKKEKSRTTRVANAVADKLPVLGYITGSTERKQRRKDYINEIRGKENARKEQQKIINAIKEVMKGEGGEKTAEKKEEKKEEKKTT